MTAAVGCPPERYPYVWTWRHRAVWPTRRKVPWFGDGIDRTGQRCRVLVRSAMNSALIEFADGYQVVTSRGGLRKARTAASPTRPT